MDAFNARNLVILLGVALVIVRFWTSSQRSALVGLLNPGGSGPPAGSNLTTGYNGGPTYYPGGKPGKTGYPAQRGPTVTVNGVPQTTPPTPGLG